MNPESELAKAAPTVTETSWATLQRANLDASLGFLAARTRFMRALDSRGRPTRTGVEVVGIGLGAIRRSLQGRTCRELLSIGTENSVGRFEASHATDYQLLTSGVPMVSLYDYDSTDSGGHIELLRRRPWANSYYCASRIQLKIVDRRCVLMEIPPVGGARTVIAVTDRAVTAEALRYFRIVQSTAVPVGQIFRTAEPVPEFTERQCQVIRLMAPGRTDVEIAAALDISLRTVRYEIAAITRQLGVKSRFAAGIRLAELGMAAS